MIKRIIYVICIFLIFMFLGFLYYFIITHTKFHFICIFYKITGLYCPGCGMTRCAVSLLHGDFYQAFRYNALAFVLVPIILVYTINKAYKFIVQKEYSLFDKIPEKTYLILGIITILFAVLRNIPWFSFLAPTAI